MRNCAYVFVILAFLLICFQWQCEKGEPIDPNPPREVDLDIIGHGEGDFGCWDLEVVDADPILHSELFCGTENFISVADCDNYALWTINSMQELSKKIGDGWAEADCNVNFEAEMVIGVCANRPCGEPLAMCDAKSLDDNNLIRMLQPYTCSEQDGSRNLVNYFLVVPKTSRNLTVEIHRYVPDEQDDDNQEEAGEK